jgi:hypothetical protein
LEGSSIITLFDGECRIIAASLNLKKVMYSYKKIYTLNPTFSRLTIN